jgi:SAM-dependent methyltransferase
MTLLEEAQAEVAALKPHPHYLSQYRAAETNYWQLIPDWIADDVAERRPARCLDIGCAYGTLLTYIKRLSGCAVDATDFTDIYLSPALQRKYSIRFAVNNIELDPFPWPPGYDIILLTEVLEHFNFQPTPTLKKIRHLLLPWGRLYLSTPDAATWGRTYKYYSDLASIPQPRESLRGRVVDDHLWQFTKEELEEVIDAAELRVIRFDYTSGRVQRHFNLTLVPRLLPLVPVTATG